MRRLRSLMPRRSRPCRHRVGFRSISCLLRVHTAAEAVETQMVSAQSVGVYTESVRSPQEHEQIVTNVPGCSIGVVAALTSPCVRVIEPWSCSRLTNFWKTQNDIFLKHPCDFNSGCLKTAMRNTLESLVDLHLVEILPKRLHLPSDSSNKTILRNVICR